MARQLSSIDIHYLVQELQELVGSRIDKIYNQGKEEFYFQFHKANQGRKIARFVLGKAFFLTQTKDVESSPSDFCMVLRKHLEGKFLDELVQIQPERIIRLVFHSKDDERVLYMEFFGRGNLILCSEDIIIDSLLRQKFRDRNVLPKQHYIHPRMKYDFFSLDDLSGFLTHAQKETIVTSLATELGIGGLYAEEICHLAGIEKQTPPKELEKDQARSLQKKLHFLITQKLDPGLILQEEKIVDIVPFPLSVFLEKQKKECKSFSEAIEIFLANTKEPRKSSQQKKIGELDWIITEQQQSILSLETQETGLKKKGELIYESYALVDDLLKQIKEAKKTHSWEQIKQKLENHPKIKAVDLKDKKVTVDL